MARLIDADVLIADLEDQCLLAAKDTERESLYVLSALRCMISYFEHYPTVDAVEVVRCKDCKHYGWEQEPCHGRIQQFCKLHKGLVVVYRETFCSYGERRTDG